MAIKASINLNWVQEARYKAALYKHAPSLLQALEIVALQKLEGKDTPSTKIAKDVLKEFKGAAYG